MNGRLLLPLVFIGTVLVAGCASHDGLIDERVIECGPGQDVSIEAGLSTTVNTDRAYEPFSMVVNVANISHGDVVVKSIRVDQVPDDADRYRMNSGYLTPDQVIADGQEEDFEVPMSGAPVRPMTGGMARNYVEVAVAVILGNGDHYRCHFRVPIV